MIYCHKPKLKFDFKRNYNIELIHKKINELSKEEADVEIRKLYKNYLLILSTKLKNSEY